MRMHPWDTKPPIEPGLLVPWMAYSPPPLSVIAAAPIGLPVLPPVMSDGVRVGSLLIEAGSIHPGLMYFPSMKAVPDQAISLIHISEPTSLGMISYAVF